MPDDRIAQLNQLTTTNAHLLEHSIRHAMHVFRLQSGEAKSIVRFLDRSVIPGVMRSLKAELNGLAGGTLDARRTQRLTNLMMSISAQLRVGMASANIRTRSTLEELASAESAFVLNSIGTASPIELSLQTVPSVLLSRVVLSDIRGAPARDWWAQLATSTSRKLENQLRIGIAQGDTRRELTNRVRGVLGITRNHAATIARTSVTQVSSLAREEVYAANSDVIKSVRYVATLDSRTTHICASLDGRIFEIGDGPRPPQHMGCRSTTVPILKSWKELGFDLKDLKPSTRASLSGQVPNTLAFPEWLKRQSRAVQEDNLGVKNAKLFREGKLSINKLADIDPPPPSLTIDGVLSRDTRFLS